MSRSARIGGAHVDDPATTDVVAEAFILQAEGRLPPDVVNLRGYAARAVVNAATTQRVRHGRRRLDDPAEVLAHGITQDVRTGNRTTDPRAAAERREDARSADHAVQVALAHLHERGQDGTAEVLRTALAALADGTPQHRLHVEVGKRLGCTANRVWKALRRCREVLQCG